MTPIYFGMFLFCVIHFFCKESHLQKHYIIYNNGSTRLCRREIYVNSLIIFRAFPFHLTVKTIFDIAFPVCSNYYSDCFGWLLISISLFAFSLRRDLTGDTVALDLCLHLLILAQARCHRIGAKHITTSLQRLMACAPCCIISSSCYN